jgi:uroporphyrinogen-III synthase
MSSRTPSQWYVISLRPRSEHAALRGAASRHGARLIALSPWRLQSHDDDDTRAALRRALDAPRVLFTSPAAVRAAHALQPLRPRRGQHWFAVGAGSAAALRRAGIPDVAAPTRMDSEGLLALPGLQDIAGTAIGLVTAPGGRGTLVPALQARGAQVMRADVYARVPVAPAPRALTALREATSPLVLALSSGEALQRTLATVPDDIATILRTACVVAASDRLAVLAKTLGFTDVMVARGPRPRDLVDAAVRHASGSMAIS